MIPLRAVAAIVSGLLVVGGAWVGWRAPNLTLLNTALIVALPPAALWGRLAAAAGCFLLAWHWRGRVRVALAAGGLLALILAGQAGRYRLSADATGLEVHGLFGQSRRAWREITQVRIQGDTLLIACAGLETLAVPVGALLPADRASLERTVARRIREASSK